MILQDLPTVIVPTIDFLSLCDVSCMVEPPQFQFGNRKPSKLKRVCLMSKVIKTQAMSRVIPVLMWYPFHLIIEDGLNNIHTTTNNKIYSNSQRPMSEFPLPIQCCLYYNSINNILPNQVLFTNMCRNSKHSHYT